MKILIDKSTWVSPNDFVIENEFLNGWIDEYSIASWNNRYCLKYPKATKEDVKKEFINPKLLKINPFDWNKQIEYEKANREKNNWLTFNMNLLGNTMLKKRLGAFFTPDKYVKLATKMVREAIKRVPQENDYIILDRCAGTGNLEKFLSKEELSHCVLNTYDYTEWTTLKGIYEDRVKMIIPPTSEGRDENGLLKKGDALSENFINYQPLKNIIDNPKITIIILENPPFAEPTSETTRSKKSFRIKDIWVRQKMIELTKARKIKYNSQAYANDLANIFIWSAFEFYLRQPHDSYILFSPIKYWKSQHLVDKEILDSYLCNRIRFNTSSNSAITLIHWANVNKTNDVINFKIEEKDIDLKEFKVNKIFNNINNLIPKKLNNPDFDFYLISSQGIPDFKNGNLVNQKLNKHVTHQPFSIEEGYKFLPLWVANEYQTKNFYENEIIMKSSDGGNTYQNDEDFLKSCFVYSVFSIRNQCKSSLKLQNPFAIRNIWLNKTPADIKWEKLTPLFNNDDKQLLADWSEILNTAKELAKEEFNNKYHYGLKQLDDEINIKIPSKSFKKTGESIMIPKYINLDAKIKKFKKELKDYYEKHLKEKIFEYQLLK